MAKRLFLLFVFSLIWVIISPQFLMAEDAVRVSNLDTSGFVETIPLPEPEPEIIEKAEVSSYTEVSYAGFSNNVTIEAPVRSFDYIDIVGRKIEIINVSDTSVDSSNHVNKYGEKFLYGHNSSNVFGNLVSVGVGNRFVVNYGGVLFNYQVVRTMIYEKNVERGTLQLNGEGNYMRAVSNAIDRDSGTQYDLAIMTCYGTSYGNGDASHRFVVFANRV